MHERWPNGLPWIEIEHVAFDFYKRAKASGR